MSRWKLIDDPPTKPTGALLYRSKLTFTEITGKVISPQISPGRDEAFSLGWWDGKTWRDLGTGHECDEGWQPPDSLPTHWTPLPRRPHPLTPVTRPCAPSDVSKP